MSGDQPSFLCPHCGARSWHPDDVANGYCGRCHTVTGAQPDRELEPHIMLSAALAAVGVRAVIPAHVGAGTVVLFLDEADAMKLATLLVEPDEGASE